MDQQKRRLRKKNILQGKGVRMLSVKRISQDYGFHANTIRAWVTRDRLRNIRHGPGNKIFIREDDLKDFIRKWYEEDEAT